MIGSLAKFLSLVGLFGFHVILEPCFVDYPLLWSSGYYSEQNLQLWLVLLQKIWVCWARLFFNLFWDPVLLIFRSCDPVGDTVNRTFSYDRFTCKNFESGGLVWIPRYFGTLFCWFSAPVIQWAIQWIETSFVIRSPAKHLSLVARLDSTLYWDPVLLIFRSCDPVGTTVNCTFSYDRFLCKNFESGRLVWIPSYFGTLFCWFSAPVIQWALQWIEPPVVIASVAKIWVWGARLDSTLFWKLVLLILRSCDPVGTIVNWTFSFDRFRCINFESGGLVWIRRYFRTLFCWLSAPVIQWALKWIEPSVVIDLVAKNLSLGGSFGFHVILEPCFVDSPLLWSSGHYSELNLQLWSVPLQNFWVW